MQNMFSQARTHSHLCAQCTISPSLQPLIRPTSQLSLRVSVRGQQPPAVALATLVAWREKGTTGQASSLQQASPPRKSWHPLDELEWPQSEKNLIRLYKGLGFFSSQLPQSPEGLIWATLHRKKKKRVLHVVFTQNYWIKIKSVQSSVKQTKSI